MQHHTVFQTQNLHFRDSSEWGRARSRHFCSTAEITAALRQLDGPSGWRLLPWIPNGASDAVSLAPPPPPPPVTPPSHGFQYAALHLFTSYKIPFTFLSIFHRHVFQSTLLWLLLYFTAPSHLRFHRCRSSFEAITFLPFPLYLHDTRALRRQMRMTAGRLFQQNAADLISSHCFSAATLELGGRTNSRRVIALSLCKYHGPSLIFILLPLLPTKDPQCGPISSGLGGRFVSYQPPPYIAQNAATEKQMAP